MKHPALLWVSVSLIQLVVPPRPGVAQTDPGPAQPATTTRLIEYVPAALLGTNQPANAAAETLAAGQPPSDRHLIQPRDRSSAARWRQFEAEFGIQNRSRSWVKGPLQEAKYQLDETLFAVKEFLDHDLNFDYGIGELFGNGSGGGSAGPSRPAVAKAPVHPWLAPLEDARLKSQIGFSDELKGFVGIKLVLPIND